MRRSVRLERALAEAGARLERCNKHLVYRLPSGRIFVTPKTPGDRRGEENALRELRKLTGGSK